MICKPKVLVALSGGVDSSVCAYLLQQQGYEVAGVVLQMSPAHADTVTDAKVAAEALGIELYVWDRQKDFADIVIDYFMEEYTKGRTPNPCIVCNPLVKFRALMEAADAYGYEMVATGHYAKLIHAPEQTLLARAGCEKRDQSYMLYRLQQPQLARLLFPLEDMDKDEVRRIAEEAKLPCAQKPDSQEICFIPDHDYASYIEARRGISLPGDFISPEGKVCGTHRGIIHYTVGQRKHLGIALGRPVFVKRIDPDTNRIYLAEAKNALFSAATVEQVSWIDGMGIESPKDVWVKVRSTAPLMPATITPQSDGKVQVTFAEPLRAVAKGQSIVFYEAEQYVLGGGFVEEVTEQ